jgi:Ethanolamine utilization protein EutJ (predicted chaperonin)
VTVEELREVLAEQFKVHEKHEDEQHAQIVRHLDHINGKVARHDDAITGLKIRDAYWAGGLVTAWAVVKSLFKS